MAITSTYYFGRLHIIAALDDKKSYLKKSLTSNVSIRVGDFEWSFFEIDEVIINNEYFLHGRLAKYKPEANEDVIDRNEHVFSKRFIPDKVIAVSPFVLHPKSGVIAYHPVSNNISINQFRNNFSSIIEAANDYLLVKANIEVIDEEGAFLEAFKNLDKVFYISIEVHPSNPSNRDRWRKLDDKLKQANVEKYKETYENKKGMHINEDDEVYGNMLMAVDGYGKALISGISNGIKQSVSTETLPVQVEIPLGLNLTEIPKTIIDKFKDIWGRTKN